MSKTPFKKKFLKRIFKDKQHEEQITKQDIEKIVIDQAQSAGFFIIHNEIDHTQLPILKKATIQLIATSRQTTVPQSPNDDATESSCPKCVTTSSN